MKKQGALTERGYIYNRARKLVSATTARDTHVDRIAAICYLYGAEMRYCSIGNYEQKIRKGHDYAIGAMIEPWGDIVASGQPLIRFNQEAKTVTLELRKLGAESFYEYMDWTTEGAVEMSNKIGVVVASHGETEEYKIWKKKQKKFEQLFGSWVEAFQKKNPNNQIKFYQNDGHLSITVQKLHPEKKRYLMTKDERWDIWSVYRKEFGRLATFLEDEFLAGSKLFPRSFMIKAD
jgi:hypothetical protein